MKTHFTQFTDYATCWMTVVWFPAGKGNSFRHRVQTVSGAHPASYPMGAGGSFPGVKRPGSEDDHLSPTSGELKNAWSYTSILPYVFIEWFLIKYRSNSGHVVMMFFPA